MFKFLSWYYDTLIFPVDWPDNIFWGTTLTIAIGVFLFMCIIANFDDTSGLGFNRKRALKANSKPNKWQVLAVILISTICAAISAVLWYIPFMIIAALLPIVVAGSLLYSVVFSIVYLRLRGDWKRHRFDAEIEAQEEEIEKLRKYVEDS